MNAPSPSTPSSLLVSPSKCPWLPSLFCATGCPALRKTCFSFRHHLLFNYSTEDMESLACHECNHGLQSSHLNALDLGFHTHLKTLSCALRVTTAVLLCDKRTKILQSLGCIVLIGQHSPNFTEWQRINLPVNQRFHSCLPQARILGHQKPCQPETVSLWEVPKGQ